MAGFWEEAKYWLDTLSSHGVGVKAVSEVCPRAGGLSRRRICEIIVEKHYILYIILLLAEGTYAYRSRLSNSYTFAHFDALAFVKLWGLKTAPWPTTTPTTTLSLR